MKLVPIITPGRASPYNSGIAHTFSWIPLMGPVRQFFSQAHYGVNVPNQTGYVLTTNTALVTGHFNTIKFITDSVFAGLTAENSQVTVSGITWPAGFILEGPIRAYKLSSGKIIALVAADFATAIYEPEEEVIVIVGSYWYSNSNSDWYNLNNWFADQQKTILATRLPISSTNVVIDNNSNYRPYIDLDNFLWTQPNSIDATGIGLSFYSDSNATISCNISGSPINFMGNSSYYSAPYIPPVVGKYWYSTTSNDWFALSSWFADSQKTIHATLLPRLSVDVIIDRTSTIPPYVNLDDNRWIQPNSIDATEIGISFYSQTNATIACNIFGSPITFLGNSSYSSSGTVGVFWYSTISNDWFALSSWFGDSQRTTTASQLPQSYTNVVIISTSEVRPYINLDDNRWIQPASIDARGIGITFYSQSNNTVTCNVSGSPITFINNSSFQ